MKAAGYNGGIMGTVEFYRADGRWKVIIEAPKWVIADWTREIANGPIWQQNHGGDYSSDVLSTLIGVWPERDAVVAKRKEEQSA